MTSRRADGSGDEEARLRKLSTRRLVRMAEHAVRLSELARDRADRLYELSLQLAVERGEHIGVDGI